MKYLNIALCVLMLVFAGMQYNDPDRLLWIVIYLVPAIAAGFAAFSPQSVAKSPLPALYGLALLPSIVGTIYFWPTTPDFWQQEVWWNTETAREGMGVMIALFTIAVASITVWRARSIPRL